MGEQQKREKEFREWNAACERAMNQTNSRPPDYYIKAKIYDRNMKGGIYKVTDAPLDKGMAALMDFAETKIQNGNNGNKKKEVTKNETSKI